MSLNNQNFVLLSLWFRQYVSTTTTTATAVSRDYADSNNSFLGGWLQPIQVFLKNYLFRPNLTTTRLDGPAYTSALPRKTKYWNESDDHGNGDRGRRKSSVSSDNNDAAETLAELLLQLGITIGLSVICGLVARYLLQMLSLPDGGTGAGDGPDGNSKAHTTHTMARLQLILQKRADAMAAAAEDDKDDEGADKTAKNRQKTKKKKHVVPTLPPLSHYEVHMAQNILDPDEITASFATVGGLDTTKRELYELAVLPLQEPELFGHSSLTTAARGILLYGPPGTGKTLLAKALAKEAAAVFIPLPLSTILSKWVGESNKLVAATFSLAHKLAPAIIFIDELDTFLKANTQETAYLDTIKSEFLTLWDGVGTNPASQVLVLGATNKPQAIDAAILRRMPRAFRVPLPSEQGRLAILQLLLQDETMTTAAQEGLTQLAVDTVGYSGSDLKELCKAAAMVRIQERTSAYAAARTAGGSGSTNKTTTLRAQLQKKTPLRPMEPNDFVIAKQKVQRTGQAAQEYAASSSLESIQNGRTRAPPSGANGAGSGGNVDMNRLLMQFLSQMSDLSAVDETRTVAPRRSNGENDGDDDGEDDDNMPNMSGS